MILSTQFIIYKWYRAMTLVERAMTGRYHRMAAADENRRADCRGDRAIASALQTLDDTQRLLQLIDGLLRDRVRAFTLAGRRAKEIRRIERRDSPRSRSGRRSSGLLRRARPDRYADG